MRWFGRIGWCGVLCLAALVTTRAGRAEEAASHPLKMVKSVNPHLHLGAAAGAPKPGPRSPTPPAAAAPMPAARGPVTHTWTAKVTVDRRVWSPRVNLPTYIQQHRGLATIVGVVRDGAGRPHGGVRVSLRKPGGRIFAVLGRRHTTFTVADGRFVMTNVRPGSYRVLAAIVRDNKIVRSSHQQQSVRACDRARVNLVL